MIWELRTYTKDNIGEVIWDLSDYDNELDFLLPMAKEHGYEMPTDEEVQEWRDSNFGLYDRGSAGEFSDEAEEAYIQYQTLHDVLSFMASKIFDSYEVFYSLDRTPKIYTVAKMGE